MTKPAPPTFTLTLRPDPAGPDRMGRDPAYRLRLLLKHALRLFGMRAVAVRYDDPSPIDSQNPAGGSGGDAP